MGIFSSKPAEPASVDSAESKARDMFRRASPFIIETEARGHKIIAAQLWVDKDGYAIVAAIGGFADDKSLTFDVLFYGGGEEIAKRNIGMMDSKDRALLKRVLAAIDSASARCVMGDKGCRTFMGIITGSIKSNLFDENAFKLQDAIKKLPA